ncbi:unnamed protein product [Blepharisma stoltei]|uniref:Uncharacterized protein n=1 Tax=Blepharisma stoltei TaxID=1481888 RepID=A0AAU9JQ00_9CILI|nr:unnamed protein product [Blepharisma stoltei]
MDLFNDVLITARKTDEQVIDSSEPEPDNTLDFSRMSFFINPAFNDGQMAKPYTHSAQYIPKKLKKSRVKKNAKTFELQQLLAISEIRYFEDTKKLQQAIVRNKSLQTVFLVAFLYKVYPFIKRSVMMVRRVYWNRWKGINAELGTKPLPSTFKLRGFLNLWRKIMKNQLLRSFVMFKERGILSELQLQYYGIDSKLRYKISRYVPPPKSLNTNLEKLESMKVIDPQEKLKFDSKVRKEFSKVIKKKSENDRRIEKVMGKTYYQ